MLFGHRNFKIFHTQKQSLAFADDMSAAVRLCFISYYCIEKSVITDRIWKELLHLQRWLHPDASAE